MTVRSLPPEEWFKLATTGADLAQVQKAATVGDVIVVEQDGEIVACSVVMLCAHLEGVWVRPDHRFDLSVGRRLWRAVKQAVQAFGASGVYGSAVNPQSAHMIQSLGGVALAGTHYVMELHRGR